MGVRIATGNELKRSRTFIRKDGTLTTPEEALKGTGVNKIKARNNKKAGGGKKEAEESKTS